MTSFFSSMPVPAPFGVGAGAVCDGHIVRPRSHTLCPDLLI